MSELDVPVFAYGLACAHENRTLVKFGLVNDDELKKADVRQPLLHADFDWEEIFEIAKSRVIRFSEIPRFPGMRRDLALLVQENISYADIERISAEVGKRILKSVNLFDVYKDEKLGAGLKSYAVSYFFEDEEKTLTDKDVDYLMTKLMNRYRDELKAEIR